MPVADPNDTLAIQSLLRRPGLTLKRERSLLDTYRTGSDDRTRQPAMSELWHSHSKLVMAVARQYQQPDLPIADLVGAGQRGLHAAIDSFDPDQEETRLASYALAWIRRYIQDYIAQRTGSLDDASSASEIQLLRSASRLFSDARRACQREGIEATDAELRARVGARLGRTGDEVAQLLPVVQPESASVHQVDPVKLRRRMVELSEEILGARERTVFLARCLAEGRNLRRYETLASELGITRERVFELEGSARRKIAAALAREGWLEVAIAPDETPKARTRRVARAMDLATTTQ
ncbi:MAG TPA: sigma-70 family RNA polymerase sigma factor [Acetobacteraceae bacterium]|jgi:RNA polymerase sigma factor (sigma-70 family)|nr:sigma-70 family RNA polymerase sigma factor [Acetobacteraceae bacterium]